MAPGVKRSPRCEPPPEETVTCMYLFNSAAVHSILEVHSNVLYRVSVQELFALFPGFIPILVSKYLNSWNWVRKHEGNYTMGLPRPSAYFFGRVKKP